MGNRFLGLSLIQIWFYHQKNRVVNFTHFKPVSLSAFANKIILRVLHEIILKGLPNIISSNQSGFIKGRSINKNILLAQGIIRGINLRKKYQNIVVKLDMAKAYDRVSS